MHVHRYFPTTLATFTDASIGEGAAVSLFTNMRFGYLNVSLGASLAVAAQVNSPTYTLTIDNQLYVLGTCSGWRRRG